MLQTTMIAYSDITQNVYLMRTNFNEKKSNKLCIILSTDF